MEKVTIPIHALATKEKDTTIEKNIISKEQESSVDKDTAVSRSALERMKAAAYMPNEEDNDDDVMEKEDEVLQPKIHKERIVSKTIIKPSPPQPRRENASVLELESPKNNPSLRQRKQVLAVKDLSVSEWMSLKRENEALLKATDYLKKQLKIATRKLVVKKESKSTAMTKVVTECEELKKVNMEMKRQLIVQKNLVTSLRRTLSHSKMEKLPRLTKEKMISSGSSAPKSTRKVNSVKQIKAMVSPRTQVEEKRPPSSTKRATVEEPTTSSSTLLPQELECSSTFVDSDIQTLFTFPGLN